MIASAAATQSARRSIPADAGIADKSHAPTAIANAGNSIPHIPEAEADLQMMLYDVDPVE